MIPQENWQFIKLAEQMADKIDKERKIAASLSKENEMVTALHHLTDVILMSLLTTETHRAMERSANPEKFGL